MGIAVHECKRVKSTYFFRGGAQNLVVNLFLIRYSSRLVPRFFRNCFYSDSDYAIRKTLGLKTGETREDTSKKSSDVTTNRTPPAHPPTSSVWLLTTYSLCSIIIILYYINCNQTNSTGRRWLSAHDNYRRLSIKTSGHSLWLITTTSRNKKIPFLRIYSSFPNTNHLTIPAHHQLSQKSVYSSNHFAHHYNFTYPKTLFKLPER